MKYNLPKNASRTDQLKGLMKCVNKEDSLHFIKRKDARKFEKECKLEGVGILPILTYDDYVVFFKSKCATLPKIPLSKFNYTSGTFEKKWGPEHKTIVLMPSYSCIRKVEIAIFGLDIRKMKLLPRKQGDVIEDHARVRITRHYRFSEGDEENKEDTHSASFGKTKAKRFAGEAKVR